MANEALVHGFVPTGIMYGTMPFSVDSSNSGATFKGDVCDMENDGNISAAAAASAHVIGSAVGSLQATSAQKALLAGSTAGTLLLTWNKNQEYLARSESATTPTQTLVGSNGDHVAGAGSVYTGWSGHTLDLTTPPDSTARGFRILDYVLDPVNTETLASVHIRVVPNLHFLATTTGI